MYATWRRFQLVRLVVHSAIAMYAYRLYVNVTTMADTDLLMIKVLRYHLEQRLTSSKQLCIMSLFYYMYLRSRNALLYDRVYDLSAASLFFISWFLQ